MPTVIRKGVFETNSSSSHTLALGTRAYEPEKIYTEPGWEVVIEPGEFGWEVCRYRRFHDKASYALTHALNDGAPDYDTLRALYETPGALTIAIQNGEIGNREHLEMLRRTIEKRLPEGVGLRFAAAAESCGLGGYELGYIDHQSYLGDDDVGGPIWDSPENLDNFLFNPASAIITDNDNH